MENNSIVGSIPWPVAAAAAAWFGFMAWKSGKAVVLWAIGGGVLGLVLSTLVMGLGQATFIPFYTAEIAVFRLKLAVLAVVVVFCAGWLFTGTLHRRLLKKQSVEPAPEPPATPPAAAPKP
jgi:hypothetical protein